MHKKLAGKGAILACVAALLAGCGSSSSNSSSSGGSSSSSGGTNIQGGPAVTPTMASNPKGNVTWCIGKDTTGAFSQVVKLYEQSTPERSREAAPAAVAADQQRTQLIQREQAKSPECDILGMDVIWTAEFAGQGWLQDVTPAIQSAAASSSRRRSHASRSVASIGPSRSTPMPASLSTTRRRSNSTDHLAAGLPAGQVRRRNRVSGRAVRGLDRELPRAALRAGGSVLSADGKKATIDSPQAQQVLSFMQQGLKDGAAPQAT